MGKKRFYHLFSDGFRTDVLFQDSQAFADGMNIVALTTLKAEARPVVFSLMDNHTHFVLYCDSEECQKVRNARKQKAYRERKASEKAHLAQKKRQNSKQSDARSD